MSGVFQGEKEASDDRGGAPLPSQQYWDTNVPELTCMEESLDDDDDPIASELASDPSPSEDIDMKGIMSRKGKGDTISKGRQRASTVKCGKEKGDDKQAAKKYLGKVHILEKVLEENNNQPQARSNVEKEAKSTGDKGGDKEEDEEDLGYHD